MNSDTLKVAQAIQSAERILIITGAGLSAPRFLRMVGKATFIPTDDMVAALKAQQIIDKAPTSQKDLALVQAAFNQWHAESGRPLCQLSVMLAHTVNH